MGKIKSALYREGVSNFIFNLSAASLLFIPETIINHQSIRKRILATFVYHVAGIRSFSSSVGYGYIAE